MKTESATFDVLAHDLTRYLPIRIVLKNVDNEYQGLCEDSFSMSYSKYHVRIWWSGKAYSLLGEHRVSGIEDAIYNAAKDDLILDPLSEDCPVQINWKAWLEATDKFSKRNASFKIKVSE